MPAITRGTVAATFLALASGAQLGAVHRQLRAPAEDDAPLVEPIRFNQRLLVCNAYPSKNSISVEKNGHETLAAGDKSIPFRGCQYIPGQLQKSDQLSVAIEDVEMHSTFEVADLPASDAILLLVVEKRAKSPMIAFQSFAFPSGSSRQEATIAVIDAVPGHSSAKLQMADHIEPSEEHEEKEQKLPKRTEELVFNRVYSVEEGSYDASVSESKQAKVVTLSSSNNYVLLRTGGAGFDEELVVFPSEAPVAKKSSFAIMTWLKAFGQKYVAHLFGKK